MPVPTFADHLDALWLGRGAPLGTLWIKRRDGAHTDWLALGDDAPKGSRRVADIAALVEGYRAHADVYYGVHPQVRIPDGDPRHVRSRADGTHSIGCLYAEYDTKATGEPLDALRARLAAVEWATARPSMIIESGGGLHAYWYLAEPLIIAGDVDALDRAKRAQADWVRVMGGDDGAKDLARVLRVPDTYNRKYTPARLVRIIDGDGTRHRLDALEAIIAAAPGAGRSMQSPMPVADRPTAVELPATRAPGSPDRHAAYGAAALDALVTEMDSAIEGKRNDTLNTNAFRVGQLVADGLIIDAEGALDALRAAADRVGLDAREVDRTIRSGYHAGLSAPRGALPDRSVQPRPVAVRDTAGHVVPASIDAAAPVARLRAAPSIIVRGRAYDDPAIAAQSRIQWIIERWVGLNMISVLTGVGGSGKSTLALTMALLATRSATVAWIPSEGAQEWPGRAHVQAEYLRRQGVTGIDPGRVLFYGSRMTADGQYENPGLNLVDDASRQAYTDELRAHGVRFIIFDAWAGHLALAGLDENDASQSGQALAGVNRMLTELHAAALIITHSGKGSNGIRGSTRVRDEARVVVEATLTGETLKLRCDKANNGKPFDTLLLTMAIWSTTYNGESIEAQVLRHYDRPVTKGAASGDEIELLRRLTWADYEDGATTAELLGTYEPRIAPSTLNDMCKRGIDRGHLKAIRSGEAGHRGRSNGVVWKLTPKGRDAIEQAEEMGGVAAAASSPAILPGSPALFVVRALAPMALPSGALEASFEPVGEPTENPRETHGQTHGQTHGKLTGNTRETHGQFTANSRETHGEHTDAAGQEFRITMPNSETNSRETHGKLTDIQTKHTGGGGSIEPPAPCVREFVAGDEDLPDAAKVPTMPAGAEGGAVEAVEIPAMTTMTSRPPQYTIDAWRADPDRWWARYAPVDAPCERVSIRRGESDAGGLYLVLNNSGMGVLPGTCIEGYSTESAARAAARACGVEPAARVSPVLLPVADWYAPTEGE